MGVINSRTGWTHSFRLDLLYMWPAALLTLRWGTRIQKSGSYTDPVLASLRLILGWFRIFVVVGRYLQGGLGQVDQYLQNGMSIPAVA